MLPSPRSSICAGLFTGVLALVCVVLPSAANAQNNNAMSQTPSGPKFKTPAPRQKAAGSNGTLDNPPVSATPEPARKPGPASPHDHDAKATEIAMLQKQVKEKQQRVELLMHLFVTDERAFVQFPTEAGRDPAALARIRSEQDELRREAAACAQLHARLTALQTSSN